MIDIIKKIFHKKQENTAQTLEEKMENLFDETFNTDIIRLEIGSDITEHGNEICSEIQLFRNTIAEKYGFIFPPVHVIQNDSLQENEIKFFIREKEVFNDFWIPNIENITQEIQKSLEWIYAEFLDDIFTGEFFNKIINMVWQENCWLIWNIFTEYTVSDIKKVFLNVLKQKKSIRNAKYIFEKIGDINVFISSDKLSKMILEDM